VCLLATYQDCLDKTKRKREGERFRRGGSWKRMDSQETSRRRREGKSQRGGLIHLEVIWNKRGRKIAEKIERQRQPGISN